MQSHLVFGLTFCAFSDLGTTELYTYPACFATKRAAWCLRPLVPLYLSASGDLGFQMDSGQGG
ncbi:MAG: hypothetical protein ACKOAH_10075, partial [Pirellula sp.]